MILKFMRANPFFRAQLRRKLMKTTCTRFKKKNTSNSENHNYSHKMFYVKCPSDQQV